jgi:glutamine synthetase type III
MEFKNVPSSQSVSSYNNVIISETKELMSNEVDNLLQNSKSIVSSVDYHTNIINSCEEILK